MRRWNFAPRGLPVPAVITLILMALLGCSGGASDPSVPPPPPPPPPPPSGTSLLTGMRNDSIPATPKPAKGNEFVEPTYGTSITRVTDHAAEGIQGFARNDYSRREAFNADNSRILVYTLNGSWHLYDAATYAHLGVLPGLAGDAEPQWSPTDPARLYYLPTNGVGMQIRELNVNTGVSTVVADLAARLRAVWPAAGAAWTRSEGSPSADARYWALQVDQVAGSTFTGLGMITYDLVTDSILASYDFAAHGKPRPDHLSMSPSGRYVVVSYDNGPAVYARDFTAERPLAANGEHSDLALDTNGDDVYVSIDYQSNAGDVYMMNLRTGVRTALYPTYLSGTATAIHFSGKAFAKPGWVLVSTYADNGGSRQWLHRKIVAVSLSANPTIYNLAHTHAFYRGYWTEPHASVNRDFTRILWTSNWDTDTDTDVDAYQIRIPAGAIH